jgi:hypothetical protein
MAADSDKRKPSVAANGGKAAAADSGTYARLPSTAYCLACMLFMDFHHCSAMIPT